MSQIYKLPRPIEDYYIGKYDTGSCIYLISKEAYTNWKNQNCGVNHTALTASGQASYTLRADAAYSAHRFENISADWLKLMQETCPYILQYFISIKSEPTPDDHYILYRGEDKTYYVMNRELPIGKTTNAPRWDGKNTQQTHIMVYITGDQIDKATWHKKFPQLSSDVKAELQKLNPTRYREWEQFYMKKYPNFQPLRSQDALKVELPQEQAKVAEKQQPTPKCYPKYGEYYEVPMSDFEILSYSNPYLIFKSDLSKLGSTENCLVIKLDTLSISYNSPYLATVYSYTPPQKYLYVHESYLGIAHAQSKFPKTWGAAADTIKAHIRSLPKATWDKPQVGSDLDLDKKAMTADYQDTVDKLNSLKATNGPKIGKMTLFGTETGDSNKFESFRDMFYNPSSYSIGYDPYKPTNNESVVSVWGKDLNGSLVNRTSELKKKQDLYDIFNHKITPAEYYKLLMNDSVSGVVYIKPRKVGQSWANKAMREFEQSWLKKVDSLPSFIQPKSDLAVAMGMALHAQVEQQFYTPNLKQQNNEAINLSGKTITVIRGQSLSRNFIQSQRSQPTVAAGYTQYRPGVINCPKKPGSIHVGTPV